MSLVTQISSALTAICTEIKADRALRGDLADLTTATKSTVVGALNEIKASIGAAGAQINDGVAGTSTVYSSQKTIDLIAAVKSEILNGAPEALDTLAELAAALGNDPSAITALTTAVGNRVRFDAAQVLTSGQKTQAQTNIDAASATDVGDTATDFVAVVNAGLA